MNEARRSMNFVTIISASQLPAKRTKNHMAHVFACPMGIQWKVDGWKNLETIDRVKKRRKVYLRAPIPFVRWVSPKPYLQIPSPHEIVCNI